MARVLIVEDDAANVEILQRLLSRTGYEVTVAGNKADALAAATPNEIDLILMDIGIPASDGGTILDDGGLQVTRQLKSSPETQSIPIIATSAFAMLDEKHRFLDAGCDDVQSKPYDFASLLLSIKERLESCAKPRYPTE